MRRWLRTRRRTDWLLVATAVLLTAAVAHDVVHRAGRADRRLAARRALEAYVHAHAYARERVVVVYLRDGSDLACANVRPAAYRHRRLRLCLAVDRRGRPVGGANRGIAL
jgi:hypothetical protein